PDLDGPVLGILTGEGIVIEIRLRHDHARLAREYVDDGRDGPPVGYVEEDHRDAERGERRGVQPVEIVPVSEPAYLRVLPGSAAKEDYHLVGNVLRICSCFGDGVFKDWRRKVVRIELGLYDGRV